MTEERRPISLAAAAAPLGVMLALFIFGLTRLEMSTDLLILILLGAALVAGVIAVSRGRDWLDIQRATGEKLAAVLPAILILLAIGMLIGTWMLGGTIPALVYFGIQLIDPAYFTLTAFLATALMSLGTGTSWGSAGTMGVALMGMAGALGADPALTAGAVVSGAYFGDKLSPLSDSTNISALGAGADLYAHVRHMLYTAVPSFAVCVVLYLWAGGVEGEGAGAAAALLAEIERVYAPGAVALLPLLVVVAGIVTRVPAALAIGASSLVAVALGLFRGFSLQHGLESAVLGFRPEMVASRGFDPGSLDPAFVTLVSRGGMNSMAGTLLVILAAFLLAGAMDVSGALDRLISALLRSVRSVFGLIAATMAAGATMIGVTSHGGVTALVVGGLFRDAYRRQGLAPQNLSRSLEDSVTIVEPLMPWTVSAIFMATTLGVPTVRYLPWAAFCYGGPVCSLLLAAAYRRSGFGIRRAQGDSRRGDPNQGDA
ncbi:hypothetical protein ABI59_08535 [Acidobacteria bacterium Mor1]|nr:hypothetical protein ABI59_08535 [Acidobacteria bacterium Mor1]